MLSKSGAGQSIASKSGAGQSTSSWHLQLADEAATIAFGSALALAFIESLTQMQAQPQSQPQNKMLCLYLQGDLGAGKSTLARALLRGLGVSGKIKSPTYALVEPYDSAYGLLLHMDLYRLSEPGELEYLGVDSLFAQATLMLIEWPQKAGALLPDPDLAISLGYYEDTSLDDACQGRTLQMTVFSVNGNRLMPKLLAFF